MTGITKDEAVKMFARCAEVADTDEDIVASFANAILERAAVELDEAWHTSDSAPFVRALKINTGD